MYAMFCCHRNESTKHMFLNGFPAPNETLPLLQAATGSRRFVSRRSCAAQVVVMVFYCGASQPSAVYMVVLMLYMLLLMVASLSAVPHGHDIGENMYQLECNYYQLVST